jgi:Beta-galactosidase trimerisation domain.
MENSRHCLPLIGAQVVLGQEIELQRLEKMFVAMRCCSMNACSIPINDFLLSEGADCQLEKVVKAASNDDIAIYLKFELTYKTSKKISVLKEFVNIVKENPIIGGWIITVSDEERLQENCTEILHNIAEHIKIDDRNIEIILDCGNIIETVGRFDFEILKNDFSGFGLSVVPVKDFASYSRRRFNLVLSAACEMLKNEIGDSSLWVTGLQSGNDGDALSPSKEEIAQWLWTSVGHGVKGIFFDKLNVPQNGMRAGGVALMNLLGEASEKALAIRESLAAINDNAELFTGAEPVREPIAILYTKEFVSRGCSGNQVNIAMQSVVAVYDILMENGIDAGIFSFGAYNWNLDDYRGRCVVVSGQEIVPMKYYDNIRNFVKKGGKLIVEGRSFYFDENLYCNFSKNIFPLSDVFGGRAVEFNAIEGNEKLKINDNKLWVCRWYGLLKNEASGETLPFIRNKYGRGRVTWIPSVIFLGAIDTGHRRRISGLMMKEIEFLSEELPVKFRRRRSGITIQYLKKDEGYITIVSNKGQHRRKVRFRTRLKVEKLLFSNIRYDRKAKAKNRKIKFRSQHTTAVLWKS